MKLRFPGQYASLSSPVFDFGGKYCAVQSFTEEISGFEEERGIEDEYKEVLVLTGERRTPIRVKRKPVTVPDASLKRPRLSNTGLVLLSDCLYSADFVLAPCIDGTFTYEHHYMDRQFKPVLFGEVKELVSSLPSSGSRLLAELNFTIRRESADNDRLVHSLPEGDHSSYTTSGALVHGTVRRTFGLCIRPDSNWLPGMACNSNN
ncbi:hypothetical protein B0H13DRAFT_1853423 [Mycena leptocephala]|nr:hypothetical protein B0H13DRAFT_1853423 [Mycena leptocephala]